MPARFQIPSLLLAIGIAAFAAGTPAPAADQTPDQKVAAKLRRFSTNIQFNKDGTVRLVRLSKPSVTDETMKMVSQFAQIDYLAVVCPQVTDQGFENVRGLTNLDTLLLSESGITGAGLAHLKDLKKLERLYLAGTNVSDAGLAHLGGLTTLHTLSLEQTPVTDAGLGHLSGLTNLDTLLLSGTEVTGAGLTHLAKLKNLKLLYLEDCRIGGEGLRHLKSLEHLEHLGLSGADVGDDLIGALSQLKSVKHVELYGTKIGAEGLAELRSRLPEMQFYADVVTAETATTENRPAQDDLNDSAATGPVAALQPVLEPIRDRMDDGSAPPNFQRHVIPLLGRLGCNGRSCHGSFQGQGGFRLSMFGYDFEMDHKNLLERVDLKSPDKSLILNKPTSEEEHGGGLRLPPGSWQQSLLRRWVAGGAAGIGENAPQFERLDVTPAEIVFQKRGETEQLKVVAVWSDGTREDVTCLTRFESKDESVAEVTPDGLVRARGPGDAYVISFYDNGIFSTQVVLPVSDRTGDRYPEIATPTKIDELVVRKLKKLGIVPSELASDEDFLRRVSLDLIGTLPSPDEIREFTADPSPDKRARKIDELLERPAYVTWWTTRLCDLTGSNAGYLGGTDMAQPVAAQWRAWIKRRVEDNVGWDKIAKGILLANSRRPGQTYRDFIVEQSGFTRRREPADFAAPGNPMPHYWFRSNISQPTDKALAFGYTFMGVRLDCAQCHKHPYDQWSKQDFEQFTEFFARIEAGLAPDAKPLYEQWRNMLGVPVKLNTAALRRQSYMRIAAEGREIPWKEIYVSRAKKSPQPAKLLGAEQLDLSRYEDPRRPLVQWLLTEPNRYFAKSFVNRIWAHYFHVGIIDPPDDLNLANPPSNKALLESLADRFVESGYDMKWLHRRIANSHTYQRSWQPNDTNRTDERNFSHSILRRLPAEVAVDAVIHATANDAKFAQASTNVAGRKIGQHPKSFQARSIDYSLLIFGKPLRTTNCDCERQSEPTLLQSLYVRNDQETIDAINRPDGWIAQLTKEAPSADKADELIRTAYLRTVSRSPTAQELSDCRHHLEKSETVVEGVRDLLWALLNTQEFITNR